MCFFSLSTRSTICGMLGPVAEGPGTPQRCDDEISISMFHSLWIFVGPQLGWPCSSPAASRFDALNLAVALPMEQSVGRFGCAIFGCTSFGNKMRHCCWAIAATSVPHLQQLLYTGLLFLELVVPRVIKHNPRSVYAWGTS